MLAETDEETKNVVPHDISRLNSVGKDADYTDASNVVPHDISTAPKTFHTTF